MLRIVLLRLLESYFRHRWLYLLPVLIAAIAGGIYAVVSPPEYTASGKLYVEKASLLASLTSTANDGSYWVTPAQTTSNEIYELLATNAFVRSVIKETKYEQYMQGDSKTVAQIFDYYRQSIKADARGEKLVEISATSDDRELAYQLVVATTDAYIQWKVGTDYRESQVAESFFQDLIGPYTEQVDTARTNLLDYLEAHPVELGRERPADEQMEVDRLQQEVSRAENRLTTAENNQESAQLAREKTDSLTKQTYLSIDQPEQPEEAELSIRSMIMDLVMFMAVGFIMTIGGIIAGALMDRTLRFPIDLRHALGLRMLASVPTSKAVVPSTTPTEEAAAAPVVEPAPASEPEEPSQPDSTVLQPQV